MKHVYWHCLFQNQNSGYDDFNSIITWHPASTGYPACIRDLAYIRNFTVLHGCMFTCSIMQCIVAF